MYQIARGASRSTDDRMTILYLEALAAIAVALSVLMTGAWVALQRTGNSGRVDTIWTFSLGPVGAESALWSPQQGAAT
jgi:steroid 5-alpha reductase family enzyme